MNIKVIKKKHNLIIGHSEPKGVSINGKFYAYNKIYEVGKDISEKDYQRNKELFRELNPDNNE